MVVIVGSGPPILGHRLYL